MPLENDGPFA